MNETLIIATRPGDVAALEKKLGLSPADVMTIAVGTRKIAEDAAAASSHVIWVDTHEQLAEDYAESIAAIAADRTPSLVLGVSHPAVRAILCQVSARTGARAVSKVIGLTVEADRVRVERLSIDDKLVNELVLDAPACLLSNPVDLPLVQTEESPAQQAEIEPAYAQPSNSAAIVSIEKSEASSLKKAERIVGVGFGIAKPEIVDMARTFANAIGAEMACSMPVANNTDLFPGQPYIGLSGITVNPKVYFALGIAGASQHVAGIRNSQRIVCINKNPDAAIFDNADYGIVAQAEEALPLLTAAIGS